jgi:hypothetical protein
MSLLDREVRRAMPVRFDREMTAVTIGALKVPSQAAWRNNNGLGVDFGLVPLLQNPKIGRAFRPWLIACPTVGRKSSRMRRGTDPFVRPRFGGKNQAGDLKASGVGGLLMRPPNCQDWR